MAHNSVLPGWSQVYLFRRVSAAVRCHEGIGLICASEQEKEYGNHLQNIGGG
jgi:hypothetical protein